MDKVRCPYCGETMKPDRTFKSMLPVGVDVTFWYLCGECCATSPKRETRELAYAAALQRRQEPNRVLTWDEFMKQTELYPVWMEAKDHPQRSKWFEPDDEGVKPPTDVETEEARRLYGKVVRAWLRRPTDEERKAVRWEDD